jgi:hypothetical protein
MKLIDKSEIEGIYMILQNAISKEKGAKDLVQSVVNQATS